MTNGVKQRLVKDARSKSKKSFAVLKKVNGAHVVLGLVAAAFFRPGLRGRDQGNSCSGVVARSIQGNPLIAATPRSDNSRFDCVAESPPRRFSAQYRQARYVRPDVDTQPKLARRMRDQVGCSIFDAPDLRRQTNFWR